MTTDTRPAERRAQRRIEFDVPTKEGRVTVSLPDSLSAADAESAAARVSAVIRAMFAVVDTPAPHIPPLPPANPSLMGDIQKGRAAAGKEPTP